MINVSDRVEENKDDRTSNPQKFLRLLLFGFVLILIGVMILIITALFYGEGTINLGSVIFIGPFPIVIGIGPDPALIVTFSIILAVLNIIAFLILHIKTAKTDS